MKLEDSLISTDLGKKLKEQVKLTQELDSRLIGSIKIGKEKDVEQANVQITNRIKVYCRLKLDSSNLPISKNLKFFFQLENRKFWRNLTKKVFCCCHYLNCYS